MTDPQVRELIEELGSDDPFEIMSAAEELGLSGDPAAVAPLADALPRTLAPEMYDLDEERGAAVAVVSALGELGDARAAPPIRAALADALSSEFVEAACAALVQLGDTAAAPVLERLLLDPDNEYDAKYLASALATLGGPAQGEFLRRLLTSGTPGVVEAAVDALGQMRHRPAAPEISALQAADDGEVARPAFEALVRLGSTTLDDVRRGLPRASWTERMPLVDLVVASGPEGAVDVVREYLADLARSEKDDMLRTAARAKEAQLGSADALADLRAVAGDGSASPCSRALAALHLLDLDDGGFLHVCLEFLRAATRERDADPVDPRDGWARRVDVRKETVDAVARFAGRHGEAFLPVVDVLDALRRSTSSPAQDRAWQLVPGMTGTVTYAEFDAWRAAQPAG